MARSTTSDAANPLTVWSRSLHGHRYVLPVADWILRTGAELISASEAMDGLEMKADRTRVLEALARLTELKALRELPRAADQPNSPRAFERLHSPYWAFAEAYIAEGRAEEALRATATAPAKALRGPS